MLQNVSFVALLTLFVVTPIASGQPTWRVSIDSTGAEGHGNGRSPAWPSISGDGRFVAFDSDMFDLVAGDTNGVDDVFVHDRKSGATTRVSVDSLGAQGNARSNTPSISADGRFVAFVSEATNLVPGDTNGVFDVFVHDRQTGATTRVSVGSSGAQSDGDSFRPDISAGGRYVAFQSGALNLVPDANGFAQIYVHDRQTGATTCVSRDASGAPGQGYADDPAISADGRFVSFWTHAYLPSHGGSLPHSHVYRHDRQTGGMTLISVSSSGLEGNWFSGSSDLSADGRIVAFMSSATNLVPGSSGYQDIFVRDVQTSTTTVVSVDSSGNPANASSSFPSISWDGRFVAFGSSASNLVPGDLAGFGDGFVHDRTTGKTSRVSVNSAGEEGDYDSVIFWSKISGDGRFVTFASWASNLVPDDGNSEEDIFVRDRIALELNGVPAGSQPASFSVHNGFGEAGNEAQVLISCSGTRPGFRLPAFDRRIVYLQPDSCMMLGLTLSTYLRGTFDSAGTATTPTVPFPTVRPGLTVYAAAVTLQNAQFSSITSPISFVTQ